SLIVVLSGTGTNVELEAFSATISGTTPTFGSAAQLSEGTNSTEKAQIDRVDDSHFLAIWDNTDDSKIGRSISSVVTTAVTPGTRTFFSNDFDLFVDGKCLKINSYNDVVFFAKTGSITYAVMMDIGWKDGTYTLNDIMGVAEDDAGTVIISGVDEGNASSWDPSMTIFFDSRYRCVRQKDHSCQYPGYVPRVRVVAPDALQAIAGY
ncbi:hypothetical protein LCGC14_2423280, partial [marine sediment metagenome]